MDQKEKRLYRSRENKVIGGVCGGLGEYMGIDPVILRIIMVVLIFCHGIGILVYLIAWLCMQKRPLDQYGYEQDGPQYYRNDRNVGEKYTRQNGQA